MRNPGQGHAWHVGGAVRRPMWLEQSEWEGAGRLCRALWTVGRTWAFNPGEVGALEGYMVRGVLGLDSGAHLRPLVASLGRTAFGG